MHGKKTKIPSAFPAPVAIAFARNIEELNFSFLFQKENILRLAPRKRTYARMIPKTNPPGNTKENGGPSKSTAARDSLLFARAHFRPITVRGEPCTPPPPPNKRTKKNHWPRTSEEQTGRAIPQGRKPNPLPPPRPPSMCPKTAFILLNIRWRGPCFNLPRRQRTPDPKLGHQPKTRKHHPRESAEK